MIAKVEVDLDPDRFEVKPEGRQAWLREARRDVEARRTQSPWPVPRSRRERLEEAKRRMDEELAVEHAANEWYEHYRATATDRLGRKLSSYNRKTKPYSPPLVPEGKINVTDPDSREMRTQGQPNIQGYNAQAVVTEQQIIIAAEITTQSPDFGQLEPMVSSSATRARASRGERAAADRARRCWLLAHQPDGAPARRWVPGVGPARLDGSPRRAPGLGGRHVLVHAPRISDRPRA